MIDLLLELGLTERDILLIKDKIDEVNYEDLSKNINLLRQIGCSSIQIKNIILSNPFFLKRSYYDVSYLIATLKKYNFNSISLLIDSNPHLLNKDYFEIEKYINFKQSQGMNLEDIIDEVDGDSTVLDEV